MSKATTEGREALNEAEEGTNGLTDRFEAMKSSFADLRKDVSQILSHLADAGKSGKNALSGQASDVMHAARDKMGDMKDAAKDKIADARDYGEDLLDNIATQIRKNPGTSAAIAFGVGYFMAKLMRRR